MKSNAQRINNVTKAVKLDSKNYMEFNNFLFELDDKIHFGQITYDLAKKRVVICFQAPPVESDVKPMRNIYINEEEYLIFENGELYTMQFKEFHNNFEFLGLEACGDKA